MSSTTDLDSLQDDEEQLRLFVPAKRSTFNPPAAPKRSVADWLSSAAPVSTEDDEVAS